MPHELLVTLTRSGLEESHHLGSYCVFQDGRVARSRGDLRVPVYLRSAAKPFQAVAVVESGALERFGITEQELALISASHSSSPKHAELAASILGKAGEGPGLLRCGGHRPIDSKVAEDYVRRGVKPGRLEDNCSGKHAGMIAAAKALGEDPATYAEPTHLVQRRNLENLALFADAEIKVGVDGCAVPSFATGLEAAARAIARYTTPEGHPKAAAARRVTKAMLAFPEMVAGDGRFDTEAMRAAKGRLIVKSGAEGVILVGVVGGSTGIAVKIGDGADRALHAVVAALLKDMGLLDYPQPRDVKTREGKSVGEIRVTL
ncbi:MAG TPA: asparaginase [Planctomycetota bacterium]|nr:asparaginase [Planctomycetota bacterium]